MKKGYKVVINNQSNTATIYIYGAINDWDISALTFVQEYKTLLQNHPRVDVRENCPGGSVFEGLPIFNCIKSDNANAHLYVDGLAASMGFMVAMAFKKENRHINKYAKCMSHKVTGQAEGSAQQIKKYAEMMESLDNDFVSILVADTGKSKNEVIKTYLQEGVDNWMTAQECVDAGLFADIYEGDSALVPSNLAPAAIAAFFNQEPNLENNMKNLALIVAAFAAANIALPQDATEEMVLAKIKELLAGKKLTDEKVQELTSQLAAANTKLEAAKVAEINNMIDAAEKAKKITANMKENYLKLAKADFDSCKKILDEMKPYESVQNILNNSTAQIDEKRKDWSFSDWQKKDTKGLAKMKAEDKDAYAALLKSIPNREV